MSKNTKWIDRTEQVGKAKNYQSEKEYADVYSAFANTHGYIKSLELEIRNLNINRGKLELDLFAKSEQIKELKEEIEKMEYDKLHRANDQIFEQQKEIERLNNLLAKATSYLKEFKKMHYADTTNSFVDDFLRERENER